MEPQERGQARGSDELLCCGSLSSVVLCGEKRGDPHGLPIASAPRR
jgi:hypothetical protein